MNETKTVEKEKIVAEKLNGRFAMIGFIALIGAYLTTGQIIPGFAQMDFISKKQGYVPLKVVPYIFFVAVVLSITTTNTFVQFLKLTLSWKSASGDTG